MADRVLGAELDNVAKVGMRRPEFFGRPFLDLARTTMRVSENWSAGELELFATVVSQANSCSFCVGAHGVIAAGFLHADAGQWRDGRFGARTTAAADFVDAVARGTADAAHIKRARALGVGDTALAEAAYVTLVFNTVNRIANALEFSYRSEGDRVRGARILGRTGYRLPAILLR